MKWTKKIMKNGASFQIIIPMALVKYLELSENDEVVIQDDEGNHGKFLSLWKNKGATNDTNSESTE